MLSPNFKWECSLLVQQTINKVGARCEKNETTVTKRHNFTLFFNGAATKVKETISFMFMFKSTLLKRAIYELSRTQHITRLLAAAPTYIHIILLCLSEIQVVFSRVVPFFLYFPFLFAFNLSQVLLFRSPSHWKMCTNVLLKRQIRGKRIK